MIDTVQSMKTVKINSIGSDFVMATTYATSLSLKMLLAITMLLATTSVLSVVLKPTAVAHHNALPADGRVPRMSWR